MLTWCASTLLALLSFEWIVGNLPLNCLIFFFYWVTFFFNWLIFFLSRSVLFDDWSVTIQIILVGALCPLDLLNCSRSVSDNIQMMLGGDCCLQIGPLVLARYAWPNDLRMLQRVCWLRWLFIRDGARRLSSALVRHDRIKLSLIGRLRIIRSWRLMQLIHQIMYCKINEKDFWV